MLFSLTPGKSSTVFTQSPIINNKSLVVLDIKQGTKTLYQEVRVF